MANFAGMRFGIAQSSCENLIDSVSVEYSYEEITVPLGLEEKRIFADSVCTINLEAQILSSGIQPALGGSGAIEQCQIQRQEITSNIVKIPRYPNQDTPLDSRLLKTCPNNVRFLRTDTSINVTGLGIPIYGVSDQGRDISGTTLRAASGAFSYTFPTGTQIGQVGHTETNDNNPWKWTMQAKAVTPNTGSPTQNILALPTGLGTLLPSPAVRVISESITMSNDIKNNFKRSFQIVNHLAS